MSVRYRTSVVPSTLVWDDAYNLSGSQLTAVWQRTGYLEVPLRNQEPAMNNIIYIVGLIVIVLAILSFIGLR